MFQGEYRHTVDDKGRLAVPVRFRAELAQGSVVCKWIDGCLALFPRAAWEEFVKKIAALPVTDKGARMFQRFLIGSAFDIELDRQGRLVVPAVLREFAGLESEVMVVGQTDRLEFWSPAAWLSFGKQMDDPEAFAEHLQGLGI